MNALKKGIVSNQHEWLNLDIKPKAKQPPWEKREFAKIEKINIRKMRRKVR